MLNSQHLKRFLALMKSLINAYWIKWEGIPIALDSYHPSSAQFLTLSLTSCGRHWRCAPPDPLSEETFVPAVTFSGFASIAESHLTQRYTLKRQPVFYDWLSIKAQQLHPNMSYTLMSMFFRAPPSVCHCLGVPLAHNQLLTKQAYFPTSLLPSTGVNP